MKLMKLYAEARASRQANSSHWYPIALFAYNIALLGTVIKHSSSLKYTLKSNQTKKKYIENISSIN